MYAALLETEGYVVGASNAPSGLHRYEGGSAWHHLGWRNVRAFGLAFDPTDPTFVYLAAGNGVLRSIDTGATWRITTDWTITEVLDLVLDPFQPATLYIATAHGVWTSPDRGETWHPRNQGLTVPNTTFTQTLVADATQVGRLIVGSEAGLFETTDHAVRWQPLGQRNISIRKLQQSPADPRLWLAGTDGHGVLRSEDQGQTWQFVPGPLASLTLYAVALHPHHPDRMAVAGYETGLWFTEDRGQTWQQRIDGLTDTTVKALLWDLEVQDRLWVGTVKDGVFWTGDAGRTWHDAGLPNAFVSAFFMMA